MSSLISSLASGAVIEVSSGGALKPFAGQQSAALLGAVEMMVATGSSWRTDDAGNQVLDFTEYLNGSLRRTADSWALTQGRTLTELASAAARRDTGASAGLGGSEPRDFTFRFPDILDEKLPALQSFEYFAIDNTVPPGAIEFELYRSYTSGEARIYLGGGDVPEVSLGQAALRRSTRFLVTSYNHTFIDRLRDNYRGYSTERMKAKAARDVLLRKADELFWNGSDDFDLWGVLNYPFLDIGVSATPISSASSAAAIIESVSEAANYAHTESKQTFESTACIMSSKIHRYLATTLAGAGDNSTTLLEFIQKANPHITAWRRSYRLDGTGPSSYHGILFYRDDDMGINPIITMDPTPLPPQTFGLADKTYMIMGVGGVVMKEVGNNLLKWFSID